MDYRQARITRLARGRHWYVVYMPDNTELFVQGLNHNDAEKKARQEYPGNFGVSYTEL